MDKQFIIDEARPTGGQPRGLQAARRHKVGILWLKGFTVRDIAGLIQKDKDLVGAEKTSYVTVQKDINAIRGDLKKHSLDDLDIQRSRSVSHIRMIQNRAWTEIAGNRETRANADGTETVYLRIPSAAVRAQLLAVISAAEDRIAKLEGTFAPTEVTGKGGRPLVPQSPLVLQLPEGGIFVPANGQGEPEAIPDIP